MRRGVLSVGMGGALLACVALGTAGIAGAATLDFTGTLSLRLARLPSFVVPGAGAAQVSDDGSFHLLSFSLPGGSFGPFTTIIPLTYASTPSMRLTLSGNLAGSFSGISGGPPGGGPMGLSGVVRVCLLFAPDCGSSVTVPLTPTGGGAGFGIGGTGTASGAIDFTLRNAPWTVGQTMMTIHTPASTVSTPVVPGGFAHGPASLTSSTAQTSGVVQLVTASKVYTSLTGAFPEFPLTGVLTLHFVPEPGPVLLLAAGLAGMSVVRWRRRGR